MDGGHVSDRTLWRVPGGGILYRTPALSDGTVYVNDGLLRLAAIDADTGQRRWTLKHDAAIELSPVADAGAVYFTDLYGHLTVVDAASGEVRWKWRSRQSKMSLPTVADGIVYAAQRHRMWAVDAVTGRPLWNVQVHDHRTYLNPPPTVAA